VNIFGAHFRSYYTILEADDRLLFLEKIKWVRCNPRCNFCENFC